MLTNWSLILNGLLLVVVVISIGRLMKARRSDFSLDRRAIAKTTITMKDDTAFFDDIIAVRRIETEPLEEVQPVQDTPPSPAVTPLAAKQAPESEVVVSIAQTTSATVDKKEPAKNIMIFLQAKENRMLAGYELLQSLLAAGLRFGEGNLFHRHQYSNGQGPVLCSLAAATAKGVFDLQNMGAFSVRGLCLYMQSSGNITIDTERFQLMLDTAKQLRDDLDCTLLDFQQRTFTDETVNKYYQIFNKSECQENLALT